MSEDTHTVTRQGAHDDTVFEITEKPAPELIIEPHGQQRKTRWRYRWPERGDPSPELFDRVSSLEVKLAVLLTDLDEDLEGHGYDALEAIQSLHKAMVERRGLKGDEKRNVLMGNLDSLPEVERDV